jgi:alpha,alpha-trehalase
LNVIRGCKVPAVIAHLQSKRAAERWVCGLVLAFAVLPATLSVFWTTAATAQQSAATAQQYQYPDPPQVVFQDLFTQVEMERIFPDSKEFADAVPKSPPEEILGLYRLEKPDAQADLKRFVEAHFDLPKDTETRAPAPGQAPLHERIDSLWDQFTRESREPRPYSSLLSLPLPYVVPGSRFRELYYWDSYFTMLGLSESGRQDLVQDMVHDFAYLIDTYGHIPNGSRSYYLTRSQPPFFFKMVALLSPTDEAQAFAQYLPQLKKEYAFWMAGAKNLRPGTAYRRVVALPDGSVLNRYWDDDDTPRDESYREDVNLARISGREPRELFRDIRAGAESGWDFSSRWFADGHTLATIDTARIVPPDLNSLLFGLENAIQSGCERTGNSECAREFQRRAAARRTAVDKHLWDEAGGRYLDYDYRRRKRIDRLSAATLYPLFVGMANSHQASKVARSVEKQLLKTGGIVTTTTVTGQQWDAPNGWAPLQWIAVAGLSRYQHRGIAETVACRWIVNVSNVYRRTGNFVEKYDVISFDHGGAGGEYPLQVGFGWTNGVLRKLIALYPKDGGYSDPSQCPSPN